MRNKKDFWQYVTIASSLAILNVVFCTNSTIGLLITIIEVLVLLLFAVQRNITSYMCFYIMSICNCMEFSQFVGTENFYNMKSIRIAGVNIGAWMLLVLIIISSIRPIKIGMLKGKQPALYSFGRGLIIINVTAALVGLLIISINDNNIQNITGYFREYLGGIYSQLFIPLAFLLGFFYVLTYEDGIDKLYLAVQATLIASSVQLIFSSLFGYAGTYGGVTTLMASTVYFVLPLVLVVLKDRTILYPKFTGIIIITGILLSLRYNTNGKLLISLGIVIFIIIFRLVKDKSLSTKITALLLTALAIVLIPAGINYLLDNSILFKTKYTQALNIISFGSGWLDNLAISPRARIEEIADVLIEYAHKPWLAITGKGYLGSIKDHTGFFSRINVNRGFFSNAEWEQGVYFNLHEISSSLIIFGIFGIAYSVKLIRYTMHQAKNNAWILIGMYWFILLYGYSFTLSVLGVAVLFLGFVDNNNQRHFLIEYKRHL